MQDVKVTLGIYFTIYKGNKLPKKWAKINVQVCTIYNTKTILSYFLTDSVFANAMLQFTSHRREAKREIYEATVGFSIPR